MHVQITHNAPHTLTASCIVVTIDQAGKLCNAGKQLDQAANGYLSARFEAKDITGKLAQTLLLPAVAGIEAERVLMIGRGDGALKRGQLNTLLSALASATSNMGGSIALALSDLDTDTTNTSALAKRTAQALATSQYRYTTTVTQKDDAPAATSPETLIWISDHDDVTDADLITGISTAKGINHARELGNLPANICTPAYLAEQARVLESEHDRIRTRILDEDELETLGAGAFVSVSKGSVLPGQLIIMHYQGASDDSPWHMLVGKGVTFDTGGISLKPGAKMDEMKFDMCGAASVFGTMTALAELQPNINVVALVAAAENMPAGNASKPGDVVTSLAGTTIEILNTDAEGRLVLCDALTYGIEQFKPASVVDIATLTGACMAALGGVNSGLFTEDEALAGELLKASERSGDGLWRLPLQDDYQELLHSNFADIANIGGPLAGATTAACFLSRFTKGTPWAHLDIAGTAWLSGGKDKGSTGRPVSLLVDYLLAKA